VVPRCKIVDPVGTVFFGKATVERATNHLGAHTGWGVVELEGAQHFWTDSTCNPSGHERADGSFYDSRNHTRLFRKWRDDASLDQVTLGTPHYEDIVWCGRPKHAVRETVNGWSGYDMARRAIYEAMAPGHSSYYVFEGNTGWMVQCDEGVASSNGNVRYIQIPIETH
jgi:hypothetical protein